MKKTWFDWEISIEDRFISIGIQHYPIPLLQRSPTLGFPMLCPRDYKNREHNINTGTRGNCCPWPQIDKYF